MTDKGIINILYASGMLHDVGKYIRKNNSCNIKHHTFSQLFCLNFPQICFGLDSNRIAGIVAHHHNDRGDVVKTMLSDTDKIDDRLIQLAEDNYKQYENDSLINILKKADSLSASSDRASETDGNNGSSSPYAPLISVIGKLNNKRIAIKHGTDYKAYDWEGEKDTTEVISQNDEDFKENISKSYKEFIDSLDTVKNIDSLDRLLKKHFRTVNANTWRPQGEYLCNTTTSLYDHSKTTAAIAVCIYINEQNGVKCNGTPHIDIIRVVYNGTNNNAETVVSDTLQRFNLENINIISATSEEAYVMIPQSITDDFLSHLMGINSQMYQKFGETIDYEIAKEWQFKDCRDDFKSRFSVKVQGILDVITRFNAKDIKTEQTSLRVSKTSKERCIAGFVVNHYEEMLDKLLKENDSISKFATFLRTYEDFMYEVYDTLLGMEGVTVYLSDFNKCIYETDKVKVHQLETKIYNIYCNYVGTSTGLSFTYVEKNKYHDGIKELSSSLDIMKTKIKPFGEEDNTYITINGKRFNIDGLKNYYHYLKDFSKVTNSSVLYKITDLYQLAFKFKKDKDTSPLIALSRLSYLMNKAKTEEEKEVLTTAVRFLFTRNSETKQIEKVNSNAYILYEAIYDAVRL